jgi:hypothetical protein
LLNASALPKNPNMKSQRHGPFKWFTCIPRRRNSAEIRRYP